VVQFSVAMVTTHDSVSVVVLRHLRIGKSFRWRLSLWAESQFTTVSDNIAGLRQLSVTTFVLQFSLFDDQLPG
jgi:hypothetical protein